MDRLEMGEPAPVDEAGIAEAAERAYQAGHQLVLDRIELLALEAREAAHRIARAGGFGLVAALCALIAWFCLVQAGALALSLVMPRAWAFVIVAAVHALAAAAAAKTAARYARIEDAS